YCPAHIPIIPALDSCALACYAATGTITYANVAYSRNGSMGKQRPSRAKSGDARIRRLKSSKDATRPVAERRAKDSQRHGRRRRSSLRAGLAVLGGRAAGALSRRLHLGGGTSIAGVVAQRLYP